MWRNEAEEELAKFGLITHRILSIYLKVS
jgi:hypothetical protein